VGHVLVRLYTPQFNGVSLRILKGILVLNADLVDEIPESVGYKAKWITTKN